MTTFRVDLTIASLDQLRRFAQRLAPLLTTGGVVLLDGPLGVGKTTLAKEIGRAIGVDGGMSSPTFDLLHVHETASLRIYHVDGYRLDDAREWDVLDLPAPGEADTLVLAEWGAALKPLYPDRLEIRLERDGEIRRAILTGHGDYWAHRLSMWAEGGQHGI
ncbi:tRNA (adenosine(37)-N6)-threonylcarbamoyltransferase complex ATPase subunit type 1 TsaE [Sulfobacillus harzensis]|uniref:tRNA threonylcarbamoyladenosine biosynthesis protein TsaE n=1 Tax=Sulfobacillus harzensis TaxID=2729629 RepID=A0A7Y0L7K1_9FIRM|nr:tRNA (adenosine(37)-N6)-threonylcarbamoyltransferase complex ATPase subunit type 1 TsaE [Sulfobacillus harzensis]NMP24206.1 tRNA (adenosine(37)-N6)-threonylcarbamoyltransferase complex ATPase subunit type 1 TsaE [Sulfobacillus harzensis]